MKNLILVLLVVILSTSLFYQDADIIPITPTESIQVEQAYLELKMALRKWESININLRIKYIEVDCNAPGSGSRIGVNKCAKEGFDNGFKYTKDYKHIIPDLKLAPSDQFNCWKVRP